jgi:hypothetical protein
MEGRVVGAMGEAIAGEARKGWFVVLLEVWWCFFLAGLSRVELYPLSSWKRSISLSDVSSLRNVCCCGASFAGADVDG